MRWPLVTVVLLAWGLSGSTAQAQSQAQAPSKKQLPRAAPRTAPVQLPAGAVRPHQHPAAMQVDREALYAALVEARERAERDAAARAQAERAEARDAAAREWEERRLAMGLTAKWGQGTDCDDRRADVHPNAPEVCDLVDNDCDGMVDEGQTFRMYLDADGDGHGDPAKPVDVCPFEQERAAAEGRWLVMVGNDCDDGDPDRWRGCP